MIYYTNTILTMPHMTFIGRWSPFHQGHIAIINKKRAEYTSLPVLIMVRDTTTDAYPATIRAEYIKIWMIENHIQGTIMIVPNIEGVYWGRGVGYNVEQVNVDQTTKQISSTAIREGIDKNNSSWRNLVAHKDTSYLLSAAISKIIEKGLVVWLTGCPSSGKTTIANALSAHLHDHYPYLKIQILDGDVMRASPLANTVGFSQADRAAHIIRMAHLTKMFADHGILVICAFVSPDKKIRKEAKTIIGKNKYIEVYVRASLKTRITRDVKGMYKKASEGKLSNFTGYNMRYEAPSTPQIICNTNKENIEESIQKILTYMFR